MRREDGSAPGAWHEAGRWLLPGGVAGQRRRVGAPHVYEPGGRRVLQCASDPRGSRSLCGLDLAAPSSEWLSALPHSCAPSRALAFSPLDPHRVRASRLRVSARPPSGALPPASPPPPHLWRCGLGRRSESARGASETIVLAGAPPSLWGLRFGPRAPLPASGSSFQIPGRLRPGCR
jgi:hypothetical protein